MGAPDFPIDTTVRSACERPTRPDADTGQCPAPFARALRIGVVATAVVTAAVLCFPAHAQWKWLDANGNAQYSDRPPPPGIPESKVLLRPNASARSATPPTPAASSAATPAASAPALKTTDPELEARRKKAEADAQRESAAKAQVEADRVAKAKADNCARAKSQAATLNDGIRIARVNERGEREYLDDAQRAQEASRARSIMATDCR